MLQSGTETQLKIKQRTNFFHHCKDKVVFNDVLETANNMYADVNSVFMTEDFLYTAISEKHNMKYGTQLNYILGYI